jgi:purine-binding chemotaxis protein CheW
MSVDANDSDDDFDDDGNVDNTYLTFSVASEEYAVAVSCVTEIVRLQKAYAMPDVPSYVRGVINLRGKVIPLIDVRSRFGMPESDYTDRTVVVVLEVGDATTGLIVDGVSEVAEIAPGDVDAPPSIGGRGASAMVMGIGKRASGVSFILDVHAMLEVKPAAAPLQLTAEL